MELYTLEIDVNKQELSFTNEVDIYSGDQGIDYVQFTFKDDRWDGFSERFAVFSRFKKEGYKIPLDVNGKAEVPAEVMQEKGYLFIGLFATDGVDTVQTSSVLQYRLGQGAINKELLTPTNDIYEQWISDLNAYHQAVDDLATIQNAISDAQGDITDLEGDIGDLQNQADDIETSLNNSEQTFNGYIQQATEQAGLSEYWAGLSEQSANRSGYLWFEIDENGHLIMTRVNSPVTFSLQNGHLILQEA